MLTTFYFNMTHYVLNAIALKFSTKGTLDVLSDCKTNLIEKLLKSSSPSTS